MKTMAKLNKLAFNMLPHRPYSPDLPARECCLFADFKKMHQGKKIYINKAVIIATEDMQDINCINQLECNIQTIVN